MGGWIDGWMEEAVQSGGIELICEQMKIIPYIPSSLIRALALNQNGNRGMRY